MDVEIRITNSSGDKIKLDFKKDGTEYYPFKIVFGRNGAGKTSLADAFFHYKIKKKEDNSENIFNIKEINKTENIIVFNRDFLPYIPEELVEDSEVKIVFIENEELDNINEIIDETEKDIRRIASNIARYGGSLRYPDETLARRMQAINIGGVSFNRVKKERFSPNAIGFLENIVKEMEKLNKEELDEKQKYIVDDIKKALKINRFDSILELKEYIEKQKKCLSDYKEQQEMLINTFKVSEKSNYIAMNKYLQFIFFDEKRLLINSTSSYISREKEVDNFIKLSTAERNIIKLVYFFINLEENIKINENVIIVLDDPISSVDYDNKIGIYSFLKIGIKKILEKTNNAKFLILTHDESVETHLNRVFDDLIEDIAGNKNKKKKKIGNIDHLMIEEFRVKKGEFGRNYYSEQLQFIYDFIMSTEPSLTDAMTIGNVLRRVLEAYGTFNYKTGIIKLMRDQDILKKICDEHKEMYGNMLYRLLLNDTSHSENLSKESNSGGVAFERYSLKEKQNIAKLVLCFLYELDKLHLEKHLKKERKDLDKIFKDLLKI